MAAAECAHVEDVDADNSLSSADEENSFGAAEEEPMRFRFRMKKKHPCQLGPFL